MTRVDVLDGLVDELEVEQTFAMVPDWLLRAKIPDKAKSLYAVIQRYGNTSGCRMPSQSELGSWLHCSVDTIDRATKALEQIGALTVKRSPAIHRGQTGVTRAPNRYFLRTTDPSVAHLIPSRGTRKSAATGTRTDAGEVAAPMRPNRGRSTTPPPAPSTVDKPPRSVKAVAVAGLSADELAAFGGLDGLHELAARVSTIRREIGQPHTPFGAVHCARAVVAAVTAGYAVESIPDALLAVARDPVSRSPMRLPHDGPWWDVADLQRRLEERRRAAGTHRPAPARTAADCPRCDERGLMKTVHGEARCDHIPDEESDTA